MLRITDRLAIGTKRLNRNFTDLAAGVGRDRRDHRDVVVGQQRGDDVDAVTQRLRHGRGLLPSQELALGPKAEGLDLLGYPQALEEGDGTVV